MAEVITARTGGVLELALNRPAKKNALTGEMYRALVAGFEEAEREDSIGAVLIRGEGGVLSAGNDIADFVASVARGEDLAAADFIRKLATFPKPIVAAAEGLAVGVGTTMLLHCDLVYAAPETRFVLPFVDLGLLPEAGSSLILPRLAGMARASAWLLLCEPFGAQEAKDAGIINAIVPAENLHALAREKAARLAAKPRAALLQARAFLRGDAEALHARMNDELAAFQAALKTPQAQAALQAFLNKAK
jgi:enoyl-CoA hydratase/carnithine racemase